mgnify:CR=1 FL=1
MITIVMQEKNLKLTSSTPIYQFESNVDTIKCLIPIKYNNIDLTNATVYMFYSNDNDHGGYQELKLDNQYNNNYLQFNGIVDSNMTAYDGNLNVWLKMYDYNNEIALETNSVVLPILPSKELPKETIKSIKPCFDSWLIKMNQIENKCIKTLQDCINYVNLVHKELENLKAANGGGDYVDS